MKPDDIILSSGARTPFGDFGKSLREVPLHCRFQTRPNLPPKDLSIRPGFWPGTRERPRRLRPRAL